VGGKVRGVKSQIKPENRIARGRDGRNRGAVPMKPSAMKNEVL